MSNNTTQANKSGGVECPTCGKDSFDTNGGMKRHHAQVHGESISKQDIQCPNCGVEFEVYDWRVERSENVFCSVECEGQYHSEHLRGENHPLHKEHPTKECEWCGKTFNVKPARESEARFCSTDCMGKYNSENNVGENHHSWKGGKVTKECIICGSEFEVKAFREKEAKTCSYECAGKNRSENLTGPNSPNWEGGKGFYQAVRREIGGTRWKQSRKKFRGESSGICELCGGNKSPNGVHLDVHHIIPVLYGGSNSQENLMELCGSCHRTVEAYTKSIPEIEPVLVE